MRILLDTHALLWTLSASRRLSRAAREAISDEANTLAMSAASAFEITTKFRLGKLPEFEKVATRFPSILDDYECERLAVGMDHAALAGALPFAHGDPFDRILIAQATIEGMPLVSNEKPFDAFGVKRLW